jgi:hypothetical protein
MGEAELDNVTRLPTPEDPIDINHPLVGFWYDTVLITASRYIEQHGPAPSEPEYEQLRQGGVLRVELRARSRRFFSAISKIAAALDRGETTPTEAATFRAEAEATGIEAAQAALLVVSSTRKAKQ